MKSELIKKLAKLIVEHSTGVKKGDRVQIAGPVHTADLIEELYSLCLSKGSFPEARVHLPSLVEILIKEGNEEQVKFLPETRIRDTEEANVIIFILSETNTSELASADPSKLKLYLEKQRKLQSIKYEKESRGELKWCSALWPTDCYAQLAGMSLKEFFKFFSRGCCLDLDDPVKGWEEIHQLNNLLEDRLKRTDRIRIVSDGTDISLSIKGRMLHNCYGQVNLPDGEVATAPIEDSTEGHVYFSYPFISEGKEISEIRLAFKEGKVVQAEAATNESFLKKMIKIDEGAGRFGEIGFGTNFRIPRFMNNILFDEKIGGTIHLALGNSYAAEGGKNKSTIHWDLILDLRKGGTLYADGSILLENGEFHL